MASSEFAITNKRVIIKVGLISRKTLEMNLSKIESVNVDQSILGRILRYGTLTVIGTGGTRETFTTIFASYGVSEEVSGAERCVKVRGGEIQAAI